MGDTSRIVRAVANPILTILGQSHSVIAAFGLLTLCMPEWVTHFVMPVMQTAEPAGIHASRVSHSSSIILVLAVQHFHHFFYGYTWFAMQHSMAIRADGGEIADPSGSPFPNRKLSKWLSVMSFDELNAAIPVYLRETELAAIAPE